MPEYSDSPEFLPLQNALPAAIPGALLSYPGRFPDGRWFLDFEIDPEAFLLYDLGAQLAAALNPALADFTLPFVLKPVVVPAPDAPPGSPAVLHWRLESVDPISTPAAAARLLAYRLSGINWTRAVPRPPNLRLDDLAAAAAPFGGTREWARGFPAEAGVYVLLDKGALVYIGETGSLRGRMMDLQDTRNHGVRVRIGESLFAAHPGYRRANSSRKFPADIEALLHEYMVSNISVVAVPVQFGRKEIEEAMITEHDPVYNTKMARARG